MNDTGRTSAVAGPSDKNVRPTVADPQTAQNRLTVFSTCLSASDLDRESSLQKIADIARWSERGGCSGMLVYSDNHALDPWLVSQVIIANTQALRPLVAVQPVYMHPYAVAKMMATLGHLHHRAVDLNMVAGGFKNDLLALNDTTPHDRRYDRLIEYTLIIKQLLAGEAVTFAGEFYHVDKLKLTPALPSELFPRILVSGSSEAGQAAAEKIGALAVEYPKPAGEYGQRNNGHEAGIRVGLIARADADRAWRIAHERFPEDRKGQLTHQLAMRTSDSAWHQQLSEAGEEARANASPYWLVPFQNYKTFCPYLVGSYEQVGEELGKYVAVGYRTFILDIPANEEEFDHIGVVFDRAARQAS